MDGKMDCHWTDQNSVALSGDLVGSKDGGKFFIGSTKTGLVFELSAEDVGKLSNLLIFPERPRDEKARQSKGLRRDQPKNEKRIAVLSQNGKELTYCPLDFGAHPGKPRGDVLYLHTFPHRGNPKNRTLCILGGPVPDMTPDNAIRRVYLTGRLGGDGTRETVNIRWLGQIVEATGLLSKSFKQRDLLSLYHVKWKPEERQQNVETFFKILENEGVKAIAMNWKGTAYDGRSILPDAAAVMETSADRKMPFYIFSHHRTRPRDWRKTFDERQPRESDDVDLQNPPSERLGGAAVAFLWPTGPDVNDFQTSLGQLKKADVRVLSSAANDLRNIGASPDFGNKRDLFYRVMALEHLAPHEIAIIDDDVSTDWISHGFRLALVLPRAALSFTNLCADTLERLQREYPFLF